MTWSAAACAVERAQPLVVARRWRLSPCLVRFGRRGSRETMKDMSDRRRSTKSGGPGAAPTDYQVGPETCVEVVAQVFDADGERAQGSDEPVGFVFGMGQVLPALERALEGCRAGQSLSVELGAAEAYGERDEARVVAVDPDEL